MTPLILDVSSAQNPLLCDYARARDESGVVGVMVRVEYGQTIDHQWLAHSERVFAAGLPLGCYVYALVDADPCDEVDSLVAALGGKVPALGVWLDVETRNNHAPSDVLTWVDRFGGELGAVSIPMGIYTGKGFWSSLGAASADPKWAARKLWVANYGATSPAVPAPWGAWGQPNGPVLWQRWGNTIWQGPNAAQTWGKLSPGPGWRKVASSFPIAGISGEVDVNVIAGDDLSALHGGG